MSKARNFGVNSDIEQKDEISDAADTTEVSNKAEMTASGIPAGEHEEVSAVKQSGSSVPPVLVYIGPSIFRTQLISGRAFITHGKKLDDIIPDELHDYPLARMMFVTPEELSAVRAKIHDPGTALGNAYKTLSGK